MRGLYESDAFLIRSSQPVRVTKLLYNYDIFNYCEHIIKVYIHPLLFIFRGIQSCFKILRNFLKNKIEAQLRSVVLKSITCNRKEENYVHNCVSRLC